MDKGYSSHLSYSRQDQHLSQTQSCFLCGKSDLSFFPGQREDVGAESVSPVFQVSFSVKGSCTMAFPTAQFSSLQSHT